jgi:hypothetical protein
LDGKTIDRRIEHDGAGSAGGIRLSHRITESRSRMGPRRI